MMSVAIWFVSRRSQLTHALLMFADLGAKNDFTPDECGAMQCVRASLALPLKMSRKVIEGSRRRKKKVSRGCSSFRICKTFRKVAAVKSLSEARALRRLVYIEWVNFGTSERQKRKKLPPPIMRGAESRRQIFVAI